MTDTIEFNNPEIKLLVVEDDFADRSIVERRVLEKWPECNIVHAKSVFGAYEALRKDSFDMVLLDLNLQDGIGPNTVKEVRRYDRNVPIIVMTGMLTPITADQSSLNGATKIISKSEILSDDFFDILGEILNASKA